MPPPVVAVVARNDAGRMAATLDSVLAQEPTPAVVVVDDQSRDATAAVVGRYAAGDPSVSYMLTDVRMGPLRARNEAFRVAVGRHPSAELFAWVDAGDAPGARWLELLVRALERRSQRVAALPAVGPPVAMRDVEDPNARVALAGRCPWPSAPTGILYRVAALQAAAPVRAVRDAVGLLAARLALSGELATIDNADYTRAELDSADPVRAFPDGTPLGTMVPAALTRLVFVRGPALWMSLRSSSRG